MSVDLRGAYDRFRAQVGVDDEVSSAATVVFEVLGDGRLLERTPVLTPADAARALDIDVTGVERLTLQVTDGGDGINYDHADWGVLLCFWSRHRSTCGERWWSMTVAVSAYSQAG